MDETMSETMSSETMSHLKAILAEVSDLTSAQALLQWDEEVNMPPGGAEARAEQKATLARLAHEGFTRPEVGELLAELESQAGEWPYDSDDAALVRVTRREYDQATKVPTELVTKLSRASSEAHHAWIKARGAKDYGLFLPGLEKLVDLQKQKAEALGYEEEPYDALLNLFEPGMKTREVVSVFDRLRPFLVEKVRQISERLDAVDSSVLHQEFDEQRQLDFTVEVIGALGYDLDHGRQDRSVHPFTTGFDPRDIRITTRVWKNYLPAALFASIHEAGHAVYEQGIDLALRRTPVGNATSMGIHESQSRLYENLVGRSRPFWRHFWPRLQEVFPNRLGGATMEDFYRAVNRVQPSLIRVEADEVTYALHIMLRFELERDILAGRVDLAELNRVWNERMEEYLGLTPPDDTQGVLQDIHWSFDSFGYFPTYALGTLMSVQIFETARQAMPDLDDRMAAGEFTPLREWLREQIHRHGAKFTSQELLERVTGSRLDPEPFMAYIDTKYGEIYGG